MSKKNKGGFYISQGTVWPYDTLVCLGVTRDEIKEFIRRKVKGGLDERSEKLLDSCGGRGSSIMFKDNSSLIWLSKFPTTPEDMGILAHEILHTVVHILAVAGMSLTPESEEAYTYFVQYMTEDIYTKFKLCG